MNKVIAMLMFLSLLFVGLTHENTSTVDNAFELVQQMLVDVNGTLVMFAMTYKETLSHQWCNRSNERLPKEINGRYQRLKYNSQTGSVSAGQNHWRQDMSELEPVSRVLRECLKSLSKEEVEVQLKLLKKIKRSYRLDLESIHLALEASKKGGTEIVYPILYRLVGKESLDEWLKNPAVAKQKIKETKDLIAEVEQLISLLKAKLGSLSPKAR
ncbi:MAG: hypothetical protein ABSG35_21895 [Syntrophobacteraceae bacterium]|jgi:hypothetical protein